VIEPKDRGPDLVREVVVPVVTILFLALAAALLLHNCMGG